MRYVSATEIKKAKRFKLGFKDIVFVALILSGSVLLSLRFLVIIPLLFLAKWAMIGMYKDAKISYFHKGIEGVFSFGKEPPGYYWQSPTYKFVLGRARKPRRKPRMEGA